MKNIRNYLILFTLLVIIIFTMGCTTFSYYPEGVWVCEELDITINFDYNKEIEWAAYNGKGTIIIDGQEKEIVCGIGPTGHCNFLYNDDVDKHPSERSYIYTGMFKHKGENKMTFTLTKSKERYTFVKKENTFKPPTGTWICEKLGITINFDYREFLEMIYVNGRGTIEDDSEEKEIACGLSPFGAINFLYNDDVDKPTSERTNIYSGHFTNRGKEQMILTLVGSKETYTFVKKE